VRSSYASFRRQHIIRILVFLRTMTYSGEVSEQLIYNDRRVIFPSGKQRLFLDTALKNITLSWATLAEEVGVHRRTFFDWRREKYSLPLSVCKNICEISGLEIPVEVEIREPFWSVEKAGSLGGNQNILLREKSIVRLRVLYSRNLSVSFWGMEGFRGGRSL